MPHNPEALDEPTRKQIADLEQENAYFRQQVTYWLEQGCIPPPTKDELKNYACGKCGSRGVKLWRGVHGCKNEDGNELLCATCLAPGIVVGDDGKTESKHGPRSDQINGWLPAVPSGDTFWGYTSVPAQAVGWWIGQPTYPLAAAAKAERRAQRLLDIGAILLPKLQREQAVGYLSDATQSAVTITMKEARSLLRLCDGKADGGE